MTYLARSVTMLAGGLGLDVAGLDPAALRETLQREVSAHLALAERCVTTDADVHRRAVRQARAIWETWRWVDHELEVALGERREGEL